MTVANLIWSNRRAYAFLLFIFSAGVALLYALDPGAAKLAGFAFAGILLRDVGYFRRTVQNWPVIKEAMDWNKVTELLRTDAPPNAEQDRERI